MKRVRRVGFLLIAATLLLATVAAGAAPQPASPPGPRLGQGEEGDEGDEGGTDPFDRLAGCIGATGQLLVVLLVDESGSLKQTDPDDQRVAAARAALASLDRLRATAGADATRIDVLVSTFSFDFRPVDDWTVLDAETRTTVDRRIADLADRDSSVDTDFYNALDGARQALAERSAEVGGVVGGEVCKAVLLFTDGNFVLGARTTAEEREQYGTTKTYAPDIVLDSDEAAREATAAGVEALCQADGVADELRNDRITLITVPLTEGIGEGPGGLIEAITTGRGGDRTCGDPDTDVPGVYLPAADTDELLRNFDLVATRIAGGALAAEPSRLTPCVGDPCDDGTVDFSVDSSLRRVHLFATVPGAGGRLVMRPPEGEAVEIPVGDEVTTEADGVPLAVSWISEGAATVDLEVPADDVGAGTWQVGVVVDDDPGGAMSVVQVVNFSAIVAVLTGDSRLTLGEESTLAATITAREGDDVDPMVEDAVVTALITDPLTGQESSLRLTAADAGFTAPFTVAREVTAAALRVSVRLEATTAEGARVSSVAPAVDLAVRRPEGYPQLALPRVELTSITGEGTAEGEIVLVAPADAEGCAWLDDLQVIDAPAAAGAFSVAADGLSRDEAGCTPITSSQEVSLQITATDRADGLAFGYVRLFLARGSGEEPIATDVPVSFEMARGVDAAKRLVVVVGLGLAGMLLPLALLVVINLLTTRFQTLSHVRAARVPVAIDPDDRIVRTDGVRRGLSLVERDFHPLKEEGGHRRFTWGGLVFRARTPLNPFGQPYATIAPAEGTADVRREGRRSDLALGLTGSWLFLLDPDASRAAIEAGGPAREVRGHVVAFVATGPLSAQTARLGEDLFSRLPATARRLGRLAGLPTAPRS